MAGRGGETFEKRRREKARLERQAAKRERRLAPKEEEADERPDEMVLMERFRVLSERHAEGKISDLAYAAQRREIFAALGIES